MSDASLQLMCKVIGWEITTLKDCSQFIKDGTHGTHKRVIDGIPLLSAKNITKSGKVEWNSSDSRVSEVDYQKIHSKYSLQKDDLLLTVVGTLGRRALVPVCVKFTIQRSIGVIRTNNEELLPSFLYHYCDTEAFQKQLELRSNATAQAGVYLGELAKIPLPLPPLPEQQKIAAILTSVDEVIEKTQAQINKLKDLKTGMMQELLTRGVGVDGKPHTEFKDSPVGRIPKGWKVEQISTLCSHVVDCVNKTAPVVDYKTPYKMIRTTNVRHGRVDTVNVRNVTKETYDIWTRRLLPEIGDLIFTREAPVGECGILEDAKGIFLGQRTMMYRADESKTSSYFLMYSLMSEYGKQQLEDFSGGSTVPHMRVPDCGKVLIKLPSKKEQNTIVNSLKSVDVAIKNKEHKLKKMNDTKKALMQDLLTGKVRVKVDS